MILTINDVWVGRGYLNGNRPQPTPPQQTRPPGCFVGGSRSRIITVTTVSPSPVRAVSIDGLAPRHINRATMPALNNRSAEPLSGDRTDAIYSTARLTGTD